MTALLGGGRETKGARHSLESFVHLAGHPRDLRDLDDGPVLHAKHEHQEHARLEASVEHARVTRRLYPDDSRDRPRLRAEP